MDNPTCKDCGRPLVQARHGAGRWTHHCLPTISQAEFDAKRTTLVKAVRDAAIAGDDEASDAAAAALEAFTRDAQTRAVIVN